MKILTNIEFWSAICGFLGALLTFKFGLPAEIHADGHRHLVLEQIDKSQVYMAAAYDLYGGIGLLLIAASFFLQLVGIIKNSGNKSSKCSAPDLKKERARDVSL